MFFRKKFGLVFDFDQTVAYTFAPSPNGKGVNEAYEHAIESLFGERALFVYQQKGGLRNRSPREVVDELVELGFGDNPNISESTDRLVEIKIEFLTSEFGQPLEDGSLWPRLTSGFAEYWTRASFDLDVFTAILSSGHRDPISKVFEMNYLQQPDIMVTDDELRKLPEPICKPDPRLWSFLLERVGEVGVEFAYSTYIGDDLVKDGELAKRAGVPFRHFCPSVQGEEGVSFSDWSTLELPLPMVMV